jgi:hypothetical protein
VCNREQQHYDPLYVLMEKQASLGAAIRHVTNPR